MSKLLLSKNSFINFNKLKCNDVPLWRIFQYPNAFPVEIVMKILHTIQPNVITHYLHYPPGEPLLLNTEYIIQILVNSELRYGLFLNVDKELSIKIPKEEWKQVQTQSDGSYIVDKLTLGELWKENLNNIPESFRKYILKYEKEYSLFIFICDKEIK